MLESAGEKSTTNWKDILGVARRRRWWFLTPFFLVWAITITVVCLIPANYRSQALILVSHPSVPSDYVAPNVQIDLAERLQNMTQQILGRTQLQRIIRDFHLYSEEAQKAGPDKLVALMRKDVHIDPVPLDSLNDPSVNSDPAAA